MSRIRRSSTLLAAAGAALAVSAAAPRAEACGGFFCSSSPVDQTAEHILFTVNDDQTVTAYVQIQYSGDRDSFAWVVPAAGIPKLDTNFPDQAMRSLSQATDPQYFKNTCNQRYASAGSLATVPSGSKSADNAGVTVLAMQAVGPYETTTVQATDSTVLVKWLQDHSYRITDKMIPLLQPYVESGMNFVALRLQADKAVSDIQPLGMTYDGNKPSIPLRLTAIAAQPEMGIVAWVLGDKRWAPDNYIDLKIPDELITFDQYGSQNNYLTLVSSDTDKVGGQAFVTEYAKPTSVLIDALGPMFAPTSDGEAAKTAILNVLSQHPYITRLYTRMSAEEMTADPTFMVSSKTGDVDNVHDLSDPKMADCNYTTSPPTPPPIDPCTFSYCGRRGVCVSAAVPGESGNPGYDAPACACASDAVARVTTTGAYGAPAMYCEPVASNFDGASDGGGGVTVQAACEGFDCGTHGACVSMNGNPTCQCEAGYAAVVSAVYDPNTGAQSSKVTCTPVPGPIPALPRLPNVGSTTLPANDAFASSSGGCNVGAGSTTSSTAGLLTVVGLALSAVRRRRRARN
ncbi:MAG TPA: DUF2330 domain-containing protein [Polyangiaceae bacterium]|jgi:MYXO-CTERM domain-containing protein|nr:DUF2330 domain-containing protein [Polyangiaceae bacterium]